MAALRGMLAIVAQLRQLLIEGLDGGFLLAKDFLYQFVAMGFERLLLGEEFIDRIVGHVDYDPIARKAAWDRTMASASLRLKGGSHFAQLVNQLDGREIGDLAQVRMAAGGQRVRCRDAEIVGPEHYG